MSTRTDNAGAPDGRNDGPDRRTALYATVAAISALIVLLWAMIVPAQLGSFSLFSEEDQRGWASIKASTDAQNEEFQRALGEMRASLEEATVHAEAEDVETQEETADSAVVIDEGDITELRARLEANGTKTQSESDDNGQ